MDDPIQAHRTRQGAILFLLLLGPAPISLLLVILGDGLAAIISVLAATVVLVGLMLGLYFKQRRDAGRCDLKVLPKAQVLAMLLMLGGIGGGTFFLPHPDFAPIGLVCLLAVIAIIYGMAVRLRATVKELEERGVVLVLGLMVCLIALANGCL